MDYTEISRIMRSLGVAEGDYTAILKTYFTTRLLLGYYPDCNFTADSLFANEKLQSNLTLNQLSIRPEHLDLYAALCKHIQQPHLVLDFLRALAPGLIADEASWSRTLGTAKDGAHLKYLNSLYTSFPNPETPITAPDASRFPQLTWSDLIPELWYAIFYLQLMPLSVERNAKVDSAVRLYSRHYWPSSMLLSDYAALYLAQSESERKTAVSRRRKRIDSPTQESGLSDDDCELAQVLTRMLKVPPHQVINQLFFGSNRNDLIADVSVAGQIFLTYAMTATAVLIASPSPDFIAFWERSECQCTAVMAVADPTIASLYQKEFSTSTLKFCTFESLADTSMTFDASLLMCRDFDPFQVTQCLSCAAANSAILAVMPETSITAKDGAMLIPEIELTRVMPIPPELSHSMPRKKVLIWAKKSGPCDHPVQFQKCTADLDLCVLCPDKGYQLVPRSLLGQGKTLVQIDHLLSAQGHSGKSLKEAEIFHFSSEISIHYTVKEKTGFFCGKACYRQKLPQNAKRKQGSRLTDYIERGLRVKDMAEMDSRLEAMVMADTEAIWTTIADDILDFYKNDLRQVSLKTLWICSRRRLLSKSSYNDQMCRQLFCSGKSHTLSALRLATASEQDYLDAMNHIGMVASAAAWKQISIIVQAACEAAYIDFDPVTQIVRSQIDKERKRVQEIRDALVKKQLSYQEMTKLLQYATASGQEAVPLCVHSSLYLAPIIRLFTACSTRELCALTWRKWVHDDACGISQLLITHTIADDGRLIHVLDQSPIRLRCIPTPAILDDLLAQRLDYICRKQSCTRESLLDQPMILASEKKPGFCSPPAIAKVCREALQAALADLSPRLIKVPQRDGEVDINLSDFYGDIYRSSFRFYSRRVSHLTDGELCYLCGLKPPDTLSAHYIDYANIFSQKILRIKLARWADTLLLPDSEAAVRLPVDPAMSYILSPEGSAPVAAALTIHSSDTGSLESAKIHLDCPHGLTGEIIIT